MVTSYHPQSDGQTEVVNWCLEAYLRCFTHEQPKTCSLFLPWVEYSFNTGFHTSTRTTPFKIVYGRDPPPLHPFVRGETHNAELEAQLLQRDDMLRLLKSNLMKAEADSKRRELSFDVGDSVFTHEQPTICSLFLPWVEYSFNTGFHTSTRTTPFKIVYGRDPPPLHPFVRGETHNAELEAQLLQELSFDVGDSVLLRVQPYRQHTLAKRRYEKLSPRLFGPCRVLRRIGQVGYELELPTSSKVYPIFHVSLLRPAFGQIPDSRPAPLPITSDRELILSPSKILSHRWVKVVRVPTLELLVQWDGRPPEEASWENYDLLARQFPSFRLEDKSNFQEVSTDTIPPLQTYSRRRLKEKESDKEQMMEDQVQLSQLLGLHVSQTLHNTKGES
ncbi:hypothetical protein GQ457_07G011750 [Hibiscus cannabinus]